MIQTNLIGRKVKACPYSGPPEVFITVVGVFLDRGEVWIITENPKGGMSTQLVSSAFFVSLNEEKQEEE